MTSEPFFILSVSDEACEGNVQQIHSDVQGAVIDRFADTGLKAQYGSASG
jgi:hypothetical protein